MTEDNRQQMDASEIRAFVADAIAAGCDICAVGHENYVIDEVEQQASAKKEPGRIGERYGNQDPLSLQIVAYLGRSAATLNCPPKNSPLSA
ncbi:hypothetical protein ACIQUG_33345 [Ensifer sp. NPDC090286]|uniref:hypothetical protein n=1 Tax=Ensifer sp. NPDC090286 TaxID=3363991 RepID=UPI003839D5CD